MPVFTINRAAQLRYIELHLAADALPLLLEIADQLAELGDDEQAARALGEGDGE